MKNELILRSCAKRGVSKDGASSGFETAQERLLTMRTRHGAKISNLRGSP
jgi:hypothetical protein